MTEVSIGLIWAEAEGGIIGSRGVMPWHLPEDLAHFKDITSGNPVLMGRKTWESLPPRFRPLPGRRNIVITRQSDWRAEGAEVAHSLDRALELARASDAVGESDSTTSASAETWVIGGAEIFAAVIDRADRLEVTEIRARFDGDTTAPAIDHRWQVVATDPDEGWHTSRTGLEYRFLSYTLR